MKHILVIDDTPSKVDYLKKLENDNCSVTFAYTFVEARRIMREYPEKFDTIYLDHNLDNNHTGVDLLKFLKRDKTVKPGCRIKPNSDSEKCNFALKKEIVALGLTRRETKK